MGPTATSTPQTSKNRLRVSVVAALVLGMSLAAMAPGNAILGQEDDDKAGEPSFVTAAYEDVDPTRVVIGFHDGIPDPLPSYVEGSGGTVVMQEPVLGFVVVSLEPGENKRLIADAEADPSVEYAELDVHVTTQHRPNDLLWNQQWGSRAINLMDAWDITFGSHDVHIHILDTGVDPTHLDLLPNLSPECIGPTSTGWSTVGVGKPGGQESGFHGTHVAGIAGAVMDNTIGIAGTSQSCLTSVQVLAAESGLATWVAAGIRWSADNGADVISLSLGSSSPSSVIQSAVSYADAQGVLQVAAAGNDDCAPVGYPAAYDQVMSVAALAHPGSVRASYSNCGPENEISAPGNTIFSTLPGNTYGPLSGTSMATPYVSGVAGLVWAANATLTHEEVRCILTATAVDLGTSGRNDAFGWGRLDAFAATTAAVDPSTVDTSRGVCPQLQIEKTAQEESITAGDDAAFTILVKNAGDAKASGVVLTDEFPGGVAWSPDNPACTLNSGILECVIGDLGPGDAFTVTVEGTTPLGQCGGQITNEASATASIGPTVQDSALIEVLCADLFDPGFAYLDVDNNGVFQEGVDIPLETDLILSGTYVVENATHGLVIPPSVGPVNAQDVRFQAGEEGHLIVRTPIAADNRAHLWGGSLLDADGVQVTAGARLDLGSHGDLQAVDAQVHTAGMLQVQAEGEVQLDSASLTSTGGRIFVSGERDVQAAGAVLEGHESVRVKAGAGLHLGGATLASDAGDVRLDAGGSVRL